MAGSHATTSKSMSSVMLLRPFNMSLGSVARNLLKSFTRKHFRHGVQLLALLVLPLRFSSPPLCVDDVTVEGVIPIWVSGSA